MDEKEMLRNIIIRQSLTGCWLNAAETALSLTQDRAKAKDLITKAINMDMGGLPHLANPQIEKATSFIDNYNNV